MSASALQFIDYNCSTLYLSSLDIVITISINNTVLVHQNVISCSNGSGLLIFDQDLRTCNGQVSVCGHVTTGLNNATDCLLSCTRTVLPPCLQPTSQPDSKCMACIIYTILYYTILALIIEHSNSRTASLGNLFPF